MVAWASTRGAILGVTEKILASGAADRRIESELRVVVRVSGASPPSLRTSDPRRQPRSTSPAPASPPPRAKGR
jgi:hypothetical protein